jgi:hypothetical protein
MSAGELHAVDVAAAPEAALAALARTAEEWGGDLEPLEPLERADGGGSAPLLRLPVVAGLRRGWVSGAVTAVAVEGGARVTFHEQDGESYVHAPAVAVLAIAGLGGLLTVVWPFYPRLLAVAPLGAVLALSGWFLILARLRTSGPREFLEAVTAEVGRERGDGQAGQGMTSAPE